MHTVSPVHVYVENHVKTPMVGTSIDDTVKNLNKEKQKKKASTTTKAQANRNTNKKAKIQKNLTRTRSYSPNDDSRILTLNPNTIINNNDKDTNASRWIPPPGRTTNPRKNCHKENVYDEIPERDTNFNIKSSCEVCVEAKQRSRSPSIKYNSNENLNKNHDEGIDNDSHHHHHHHHRNSDYFSGSFTSSANSFNEFLKYDNQNKQKLTRSLEDINNQTYTLENKPKTLFENDIDDQINRKSILKNNKNVYDDKDEFIKIESKLSNHELLIQKLIECEGVGNDITKQLSALKDFLKLHFNENQISSLTVKRLENDRDMLLRNLETYENVNRDLKGVIYDLKAIEKNDYRRNLTNESLIKHIDGLEQENNHLKKLILDMEKNNTRFGSENDQFRLENSALCNLKMSLENNRAHLQKQLNNREAEISRLNVKLRISERKIDRLKTELDDFKKSGPSDHTKNKNVTINNKEAEKSIDIETKQIIAKLQNEIRQKDVLIKELVQESKKFDSESSSRFKENGGDTQRSKSSVDTARNNIKLKDEKLKNAEIEINKLKSELEHANLLISKFHEANTKVEKEANDALQLAEEKDNEAKRIKHFRELELDKVRAKLQQRLNELEPLPELLKNTELKLHEALKKQKEYEAANVEQAKIINELNAKNEKLEILNAEKDKALKLNFNSSHVQNLSQDANAGAFNKTNLANDAIERKIKSLEDENHDLFRQLTIKDEALRDSNNRLTNKTNEASSLSRQLELALNDSKLKEEHIKDKYSSKERSLQARCIELETQLSKLKIDHNGMKRDKEEIEYKYQSQIKDLKDRLEQSYNTNKSMQNYVNFLKNSYSSMFSDNAVPNGNSYSINNGDLNGNFTSKTGNMNLF